MKIEFNRLDHLQICIPHGQETKAREFYCEILGLAEIEKPEVLKKNGGFWLTIADIQLHIGTESTVAKSKRHPAFEVNDLAQVKHYLSNKGVRIQTELNIPGVKRCSIFDYWNNRIELLQLI